MLARLGHACPVVVVVALIPPTEKLKSCFFFFWWRVVSATTTTTEPAKFSGAGAGGEIGIGFTFAPGQQGTSPGKVFHDARASDPAPGKLYLQNKSNDLTTALPPGQTFSNYGQWKKLGGIGR
jgi:hypothetical protein